MFTLSTQCLALVMIRSIDVTSAYMASSNIKYLSMRLQEKAQAKLKVLEERAEEQRKAKAAHDEEWRRQQRERELQRAKVILLLTCMVDVPGRNNKKCGSC